MRKWDSCYNQETAFSAMSFLIIDEKLNDLLSSTSRVDCVATLSACQCHLRVQSTKLRSLIQALKFWGFPVNNLEAKLFSIFDRELGELVLGITLFCHKTFVKYKPINQGKLNLDFNIYRM